MACHGVCWDGLFVKLEYCTLKSWEVERTGEIDDGIPYNRSEWQISTAHSIKAWTAFL